MPNVKLTNFKAEMGKQMNKESWKKWNSWVLDEEEIMMIAESMGLDYDFEVKEQVERIADNFKNKLSNSESDYWTGYIADAIKEVLEIS